MSGGGPLVVIPLRDGTELRVALDGIGVGDRAFDLARIQDARQVSPDPETIGLRVAGAGLVEVQPARPGDGAIALEALYRLRPDLRPAGFEPPALPLPPGMPAVPPLYGAPLGYTYPPMYGAPLPPGAFPPPPPSAYSPPPPGYAMGPAPYPPFGISPNRNRGEMTPVPRNFGEILGAIFQLYGKHFTKWLLLGVAVALLPALLAGGIQVAAYAAIGLDPTSSTPFSGTTTDGNTPSSPLLHASTDQLLLFGGIGLGLLLLLILFSVWMTASFAIGGRDAVLGREVSVGRSLGGGLRRFFPVLGAQFLYGLIVAAFLLPIYVSFGILLIPLLSNVESSPTSPPSGTASIFGVLLLLTCVFIPLALIAVVFFSVRLGLAPYAAATRRIGPLAALGESWRITRGSFWRIFGVQLIIGLIVGVASTAVGTVAGFLPYVVTYLVVTPLVQVFGTPLSTLTDIVLLYDLRLRREGYARVAQDGQDAASSPPEAMPAQE
jgi:hypothetical protein